MPYCSYGLCVWICIGTGKLNKDQRIAVEMAFVKDNKLLLVQGPPGKLRVYIVLCEFTSLFVGTGKSMVCVEMIKRFVDHNYGKTPSRGPTILYCAPSNKAVNVGACMLTILPAQ